MSARAFIVGCGRIAGGFNETDEVTVLTHVTAYRRLNVPVVGCCDRDVAQAARFAQRWAIEVSGTDLLASLKETQPTVVSICTPPDARLEILRQVLSVDGVRAVLLEKPLASSGAEADKICELILRSGRAVLVNFFRAFDPYYSRLEAESRAGNFGGLCSGTARYYGTAATNASHWLERTLAMFGNPTACRRFSGEPDAPLFELTWGAGRIVFLPANDCPYSPFEMDLLFEKKRIRVIDSEARVEHFAVRTDPKFPAYKTLVAEPPWPDCVPSAGSILLSVRAAVAAAAGTPMEWRALLERASRVTHLLEELKS